MPEFLPHVIPSLADPRRLVLGDYVRALVFRPGAADAVAALGDGRLVWFGPPPGTAGGAVVVIREVPAHRGGVLAAAWSPDGRCLVSTGEDGRVRWWSADGVLIRDEHPARTWMEHVVWSPDGAWLVTAGGREVRFWGAEGGPAVIRGTSPGAVVGLSWSRGGGGVAAVSQGRVVFHRPGTGASDEQLLWKGAYLGVAWSPDGSHLAATTLEGTVIYWRLPFREEEPLQMSGYEGKVRALAWDRGSRWLATAGGDRVTVWDVSGKGPAGTRPLLLEGHEGRVGVLEFAPRGAILASGADDGSLFLWNTAAGEHGYPGGRMGAAVTALAWAPEGGRLAAGTAEGEVRVLC